MRDFETGLTVDRLREVLSYNPVTGVFRWRIRSATHVQIGDEAGGLDRDGYLTISVDGFVYRAHRLAWFGMTGNWPIADIDHRDLLRANNTWANLREATRSQNNMNSGLPKNNTSGVRGVYLHKQSGLWHLRVAKKSHGYFRNIEDARIAREKAVKAKFGEFARL